MDIVQAKNMEEQIQGPTLFCEVCAEKKVLSPCFACQYSSEDIHKEYCRGCGCGKDNCKISLEICEEIAIARLCFETIVDLVEDKYGVYSEYAVNGVSFRMRWIKPGKFMMGSPENEPDREDDELLHEVILTEGFWLAETACTQELWEAIIKNNPSEFRGKNRPVEEVNWYDCNKFVRLLNQLVSGLDFCLPTEAWWEYACRAGTTTPFSFGENITTDQVNYNGDYPYADGKKGKYREETVEVKSLPPNSWGLYEMHGNVWEWCSDFDGEYAPGSITNPTGPSNGPLCVFRGGCWLYDAGGARSACRNGDGPALHSNNVGFRLARGQKADKASK